MVLPFKNLADKKYAGYNRKEEFKIQVVGGGFMLPNNQSQ